MQFTLEEYEKGDYLKTNVNYSIGFRIVKGKFITIDLKTNKVIPDKATPTDWKATKLYALFQKAMEAGLCCEALTFWLKIVSELELRNQIYLHYKRKETM
jgi:hypothetical protein